MTAATATTSASTNSLVATGSTSSSSNSTTSSKTSTKTSQGRGRSNSLPKTVVEYLKNWLWDHRDHPYPTDQEKMQMVSDTGLELTRLNNWFVNNRIRYWKPRMEALQRQKQAKQARPLETPVFNIKANNNLPTATPACPQGQSTQESSGKAAKTAHAVAVSPSPSSTEKRLTSLANSSNWLEAIRQLAPDVNLPNATAANTTLTTLANIVSDASSTGASSEDGSLSDSASVKSQQETTQTRRRNKRKLPLAADAPVTTNTAAAATTTVMTSAVIDSPRKKYQRKDENLWRQSCQSSPQISHVALPTLDEAALLFGFGTSKETGLSFSTQLV